jgi:hypothetical protein
VDNFLKLRKGSRETTVFIMYNILCTHMYIKSYITEIQ